MFLHSSPLKLSVIFSVAGAIFLYMFIHCSFPFLTLTQVCAFTVYIHHTFPGNSLLLFHRKLRILGALPLYLHLCEHLYCICSRPDFISSTVIVHAVPSSPVSIRSSHCETYLSRYLSVPVLCCTLAAGYSGLFGSPTVMLSLFLLHYLSTQMVFEIPHF